LTAVERQRNCSGGLCAPSQPHTHDSPHCSHHASNLPYHSSVNTCPHVCPSHTHPRNSQKCCFVHARPMHTGQRVANIIMLVLSRQQLLLRAPSARAWRQRPHLWLASLLFLADRFFKAVDVRSMAMTSLSRQLHAHGVPFMALACGHRLAPQRPCGLVFAACPKENHRAVRARVASDEYCRARVLLLPHTFPARSETCMSACMLCDKLGCMSATVCMSVTTSRRRPCRASVC